ncbi:MAG: hypothetical protein ABS903_17325 [Solibacillus sp.]
MSDRYQLNETRDPIDPFSWRDLNENWERIKSYLRFLERQINVLAGGEEIDDILLRIETAIANAENATSGVEQAKQEVSSALQQLTSAISTANTAANRADIAADDANTLNTTLNVLKIEMETLQTNLNSIVQAESQRATNEQKRVTAEQERSTSETARRENEAARVLKEQTRETAEQNRTATFDAKMITAEQKITIMQFLIDNLASYDYIPSATFNYPNLIKWEGSTYIALKEVTGITPSDDGINYRLIAEKGAQGDKGEQGTGVNILGEFNEPSELPSSGKVGDAYLIKGRLWVWSELTNSWADVGNIQGPQGPQGIQGVPGVKGIDGKTWHITASTPSNSLGVMGDMHLNTANYDIREKTAASVWTVRGNIKGPKGDQGLEGQKGDPGEKGDPGPAGSDANVTNENIINALGYTPADFEDVTLLKSQVTNHESRLNQLEEKSKTATADLSGISREVAYLKLSQDAKDRIEGGVLFADDFEGARFGMTLNESESKDVRIMDGELNLNKEILDNYENNDEQFLALSGSLYSDVGSRKIVMLPNGHLVTAAFNDYSPRRIHIKINRNDNTGWKDLCYVEYQLTSRSDKFCLVNNGNQVSIIFVINNNTLRTATFNATTVSNIDLNSTSLANITARSSLANGSNIEYPTAFYDPETQKYHIAWTRSDDANSSLKHIYYIEATNYISNFGFAEQLTKFSNANSMSQDLNIIAVKGIPMIVFTTLNYTVSNSSWVTGNGTYAVNVMKKDKTLSNTTATYGEGWSAGQVHYIADGAVVKNPTIVKDSKDVLHVAYTTATGSGYLRANYIISTNLGVTWGARQYVGGDASNQYNVQSITIDKNDNIFIISYAYISSVMGGYQTYSHKIVGFKFTDLKYHSPTKPTPHSVYNAEGYYIWDVPVASGGGSSDLRVTGKWSISDMQPNNTGTLVYDIPDTNFVGAYFKLKGNLVIAGNINGTPLEFKEVDGEFKFVYQVEDVAPIKLTLNLSSPSNTEVGVNTLTRVLGGRA